MCPGLVRPTPALPRIPLENILVGNTFLFSYSVQPYTSSLLFSPILLLFIIANKLAYNLLHQVLVYKEY